MASQGPVVAPFRFLQPGQVLVQSFLAFEGGPVNALEHRPVLVAAPVGPRHMKQLHRRDVGSIRDVRALAKVDEVTVPVDGQGLCFGQAFDYLLLVGLSREQRPRFLITNLLPNKRMVIADGLEHKLLDLLQVLGGEGSRYVKVVVKAVLRGWSDSEFGLWKQFQDRVGHHVGRRMAHPVAKGPLGSGVLSLESTVVQHIPTCGECLKLSARQSGRCVLKPPEDHRRTPPASHR